MNIVAIIPILISIGSLAVSLVNFLSIRKDRIIQQATQIVIVIDHNQPMASGDPQVVYLPVVIKNFSNGPFSDIFIIAVEDFHYKYRSLNDVQESITSKWYFYIKKLVDPEKLVYLSSGGSGMSKSQDAVILFTDSNGKQWLKTPNGALVKMRNYKEKLFKLGIPNPGYDKGL